ncbi:MAG: AMP-binding protein, partial [Clostridium sp.]
MEILRKIKEYAQENRLAVNCDGEKLTYLELNKLSDKIATYFINEYGEDKTPIIIHGNKENLILPIMMGALKSGRAYIPLDVTFPVERVKQVIKEVNAKIVINFTDEDLDLKGVQTKESIENAICDIVEIENLEEHWVKEDENAYILFTSGSTGKPKGVQISSNNLDSFNNWFGKYMELNEDEEVMMNQVSYSFDVSVIPIYLGLIYGKTLNSLSKKTLEDFKTLFTNLKESKIKIWVSTPALA